MCNTPLHGPDLGVILHKLCVASSWRAERDGTLYWYVIIIEVDSRHMGK